MWGERVSLAHLGHEKEVGLLGEIRISQIKRGLKSALTRLFAHYRFFYTHVGIHIQFSWGFYLACDRLNQDSV